MSEREDVLDVEMYVLSAQPLEEKLFCQNVLST